MQTDWSAAPSDVLEEISKRFLSWEDYACFRSVCTSWRSAAPKRHRLPLLLVKNVHSMKLCNFPGMGLYRSPQLHENISWGKLMICGSSHGWICLKDGTPTLVYLHNSFTGVHIRLPVLPHWVVPMKVVLSSDPVVEPANCVVMANCGNRLMFQCRPGDASWTPALNVFSDSTYDFVQDMIFYQDKCYAVSSCFRLFVSDESGFTELSPAEPLFSGECRTTYSYLVECSGDLLLSVVAYIGGRVTGCEVFRIDLDGGQLRLFKLKNLGGHSIFLSWKSMSLSVDASSALPKCEGNCIYYAGHEAGVTVFNMENSSLSFLEDVEWKYWFMPSLRE